MEPPYKRMKLNDGDAEEETIDDELAMTPSQFDALQDPLYELDKGRAKAVTKLKSTFEHIFAKYERDFTDTGDEIDLETGEITINNGHLESMSDRNEDGFRSDDDGESVSPVGEKTPGEQPGDRFQATTASGSIGPESSNPWNDPFESDHSFTSLAMAPSPFGAPPPFSLGPTFPSAQPTDPAWQSPDVPVSLFRDNLGYRNQFMGYPGSLEYNSFGQVRIRSSYRDVFGHRAPRKFMTAKSFARKALHATSSDETEATETEDDDVLLSNLPPLPAPIPVPAAAAKAQSPTVGDSGTDTATSSVDENVSRDKESLANKIPRKRGRPRKSTTGAVPPTTNRRATSSEEGAPARGRGDLKPAPERSTSPQSLRENSSRPQSPARDLSPDKEVSHSQAEEREPFSQDAGEPDMGHRRSARAKKQTDFYGRTPTPRKDGSKQKVAGSVRDSNKNAAEKLVDHKTNAMLESIERSPILGAVEPSHNEEAPDQISDSGLYLKWDQQMSTLENEAAGPSSIKNSTTNIGQSERHRFSKLLSDRQDATEEDQDTNPSALNNGAHEAENQNAAIGPTRDLLPNGVGPFEAPLASDIGDKVQMCSGAVGSGTQCDTAGSDIDSESTDTNSAIPVERTIERESVTTPTTDEYLTANSSGSQRGRRTRTPVSVSEAAPSMETAVSAPTPESLVQASITPPKTRALKSRERSPVLGSEAAPGPLQEVVNYSNSDKGNRARDTGDKHDKDNMLLTSTAAPKQRQRRQSLVVVLPPLQKHAGPLSMQKETTFYPAAKTDEVPSKKPPTGHQSEQELATQKLKKPPTPKTPRRNRGPQDAGGSTSTITASGTGGRGQRRASKTVGATPPSVSSTSSYATSLAARYPHLSKSAKRISLSSLVPDDPDDEDEPAMNVLTPTSIASTSPTLPSFSSPSAARFRARLSSSVSRSRSGTPSLMSMTPRRPGGGIGVRLFGPNPPATDSGHGNAHRSFSPSSSGGPRQRTTTFGGGAQSSPLGGARGTPRSTLGTMATTATDMETPSRRAEKKPVLGGRRHAWEVEGEQEEDDEEEEGGEATLVLTPGGTARRCGVDGFACERAFCFTCCG